MLSVRLDSGVLRDFVLVLIVGLRRPFTVFDPSDDGIRFFLLRPADFLVGLSICDRVRWLSAVRWPSSLSLRELVRICSGNSCIEMSCPSSSPRAYRAVTSDVALLSGLSSVMVIGCLSAV